MDIYDIIDNIYKLPLASKEALLNETPEVTYPKGFHLFLADRKRKECCMHIPINRTRK